MQYRSVAFTLSPPSARPPLVVDGAMTLRELVESRDLDCCRYLLVTTADGQLAGVVNVAEILTRVACSNDVERHRWLEKTVESLVPFAFQVCSPRASVGSNPAADAAILSNTTLSAVIADDTVAVLADWDDVFVRWSQIENLLLNMASDPLTGLCTRSVFERVLEQELARSGRQERSVALLLFDLDSLKQINDRHGHAEGDRALQLLAQTITENLRSYDIVARYGGDEFASLCFDCGADHIQRPVSRILRAVNLVQLSNGWPLSVSIGVAIATVSPTPDTLVEMFALADDCLYRAKNSGRNRAYMGLVEGAGIEELSVTTPEPGSAIVPNAASALQRD